jgi:hypothetical protein
MADRPLRLRSDAELEAALWGLSEEIAWPASVAPSAGADRPDLAAIVRVRLETAPRIVVPARPRWSWWPARRAILAAVIILLSLAVLAGAAGLGLPGLRLILGPTPVSPPPSLAPSPTPPGAAPAGSGSASDAPGATLGLGQQVTLDALDARAGFAVTWPSDPAVGAPDAAFVDVALGGQVALVWQSGEGLPDTLEPGVGLVLTEFAGTVDSGFFSKAIGRGTTAQAVKVHGDQGFWITGDPHLLFYTGPNGFIDDQRRWVGDALLWSRGPITYRLETSLGRDAALRLAESMP